MAFAAAPAADAGAGSAAAEEKTEFDVVIVNAGEKINVIKRSSRYYRSRTQKKRIFVEAVPKPVKEGISKEAPRNTENSSKQLVLRIELK